MAGKGNILSFDEVRNTAGRPRPSASTSKSSKRRSLKSESARPPQKSPVKSSASQPASANKASSAKTRPAKASAPSRTSSSRAVAADRKPARQTNTRQTQGAKSQAKKKPKTASGSLFPKQTPSSAPSRPKAGNSGSLGSPIGSTRGKSGSQTGSFARTKPGDSGRIGTPRSKNSQGFGQEAEQREHSARISKFSEIKKKRSKNKAGKAFSRQFGETTSSAASSGPRAALYKGEMGSTHKKSARMQESAMSRANAMRSGFALPIPHFKIKESPKRAIGLMIAVCFVASFMFLYAPAQQYYLALREHDQLQAEYAALEQRNATIQSEVDYLSTEAGIEDRAREEFGWVKEGEHAVTVYGLADSIENDINYTKQIEPGSVPAPEDWYTPLGDLLFGYDGSQR